MIREQTFILNGRDGFFVWSRKFVLRFSTLLIILFLQNLTLYGIKKIWIQNICFVICMTIIYLFHQIRDQNILELKWSFPKVFPLIKSKITKILNSEENSIWKSLITCQNQMTKHIKRMDNNCHIPDLVKVFSNENMVD